MTFNGLAKSSMQSSKDKWDYATLLTSVLIAFGNTTLFMYLANHVPICLDNRSYTTPLFQ